MSLHKYSKESLNKWQGIKKKQTKENELYSDCSNSPLGYERIEDYEPFLELLDLF